jgi:hypothetical protein
MLLQTGIKAKAMPKYLPKLYTQVPVLMTTNVATRYPPILSHCDGSNYYFPRKKIYQYTFNKVSSLKGSKRHARTCE